MNSLSIPVVLGTAREGRNSEAAARFLHEYIDENFENIETQLVDVRDHLFESTKPAWEDHEQTKEWKRIADSSDGFIIVTPEYNHGPPGELKLLLDAAFNEYFDKPVALAGVSAGGFGGARVVELLKPTLIELGMVPMGRALYFSRVSELFDEEGVMVDDKRADYEEQIDGMVEPLVNYAKSLRGMREENKED